MKKTTFFVLELKLLLVVNFARQTFLCWTLADVDAVPGNQYQNYRCRLSINSMLMSDPCDWLPMNEEAFFFIFKESKFRNNKILETLDVIMWPIIASNSSKNTSKFQLVAFQQFVFVLKSWLFWVYYNHHNICTLIKFPYCYSVITTSTINVQLKLIIDRPIILLINQSINKQISLTKQIWTWVKCSYGQYGKFF